MKTINKKHILAGLLVAAAMAPVNAEAFSPSLRTKTFGETLFTVAYLTIAGCLLKSLLNETRTEFRTVEHNYDIMRCPINPGSSIRTQYCTTFKDTYVAKEIVSSTPIKESIVTSCPTVLRYGSNKACINCPLFSKKIEVEVPLKQ